MAYLNDNIKEFLIRDCEIFGYFPSVFMIDVVNIKPNLKTIDEFVVYVKIYKLPDKYSEIYFQFESWLDNVIDTPTVMYHVCRTIDLDKIIRYGISPKSKQRISFHPERIYLITTIEKANEIIRKFKETDKEETDYSILKIENIEETKDYKLLVRIVPNFDGYYTTQNIPSLWIIKV